jgi:hypothetical protein
MKVSKSLPEVQNMVDHLEQKGYKVRLSHDSTQDGITIGIHSGKDLPYKGYTCVSIDHQSSGVHAVRDAYCSVNDRFSRAEGTRVAFRNALVDLRDWVGREELKSILG